MRRINVFTCRRPILHPSAASRPLSIREPAKGELQVQPIETPHDREIGFRHQPWQVVDAATADVQNLCLLGDRQIVCTVDHRLALSNPALLSAPSKKSFSSVSSPILACRVFTSTAGCAVTPLPPGSKTSA